MSGDLLLPIGYLTIRGEEITLVRGNYRLGNRAVLAEAADGEPYATLSVNFPDDLVRDLPPDTFYLKDWSENEEIARLAKVSGLFERAYEIEDISSGFITASAWRIYQQ